MLIKITNIIWDNYDVKSELVDLPAGCELEIDLCVDDFEDYEDDDYIRDVITDALSDEYGCFPEFFDYKIGE